MAGVGKFITNYVLFEENGKAQLLVIESSPPQASVLGYIPASLPLPFPEEQNFISECLLSTSSQAMAKKTLTAATARR